MGILAKVVGVSRRGGSEPKYGEEGSMQGLGAGAGVEEPTKSEESIHTKG